MSTSPVTPKAKRWLLLLGVFLLVGAILFPPLTSWILTVRSSRLQPLVAIAGDIRWLLTALGLLFGASAFFIHRNRVRRAFVRVGVPVVLVFASIGITLVAVEGVLHFKYLNVQVGGINSPSGVTFYRKYYKLNSWGFRDRERQKAKPNGAFRILALGDSFTFGAGIKFKEDLYTALLEEKLNRAGDHSLHFEVINTGIKGLGTAQQQQYLREKGLALDPDLVVVGHVLNDAETPELKREIEQRSRSGTFLPARYHQILSSYSFTYYLARRNLLGILQRFSDSGTGLTGYDAYLDDLYRGDNLEAFKDVVAALAKTLEDHGLPVLWVSFPRMPHVREVPYPFAHVTEILEDIALQNDFRFIDLLPPILESDAERLTVSAWDGHPNEIIHAIAAEEIYERLIADRLIPTQSHPTAEPREP